MGNNRMKRPQHDRPRPTKRSRAPIPDPDDPRGHPPGTPSTTIITDPQQLQDTLRAIMPVSVAVAYIGDKGLAYLDKPPKTLIVSPTVGSNPSEIGKAMRNKAIGQVYFLDELHAKIYLGETQALVGSCNLSHGGFQAKEEAAVLITDSAQILSLQATMARYIALARRQYPTKDSKNARLKKLREEHKRASKIRHPKRKPIKTPKIADYDIRNVREGRDRIHVAWGQPYEVTYNKKAIYESTPDARDQDLDDYFGDLLIFHEDDNIYPGDWILYWCCNNDGLPRKNGEISWIFVDAVIPRGVKDDNYTKIAVQLNDRKPPSSPFDLDDHTKQAIRSCLVAREFAPLRSEDDTTWYLKQADAVVPEFLLCVQLMVRARAARRR